jgi:broad specificity phosphatase PhoE
MRLLFLARHGETDWNAANRWQGHTDVPLNDHGRAQARALARLLREARLAGVVASDLSRAEETARIVATELGVALPYVDRDLRERSFGVFEGLTRAECEAQHAEAWRAWLEHRRPPEGGEEGETLKTRMVAAVGRVAERVAREDAPALVVTHGGALRSVVSSVTGQMPPMVANGEVWVLTWEGRLVAAKRLEAGWGE